MSAGISSVGISPTRSVFAPPPPKEQVALKEMPALQRAPGSLNANIREAMQAIATRKPGQFIDMLDKPEASPSPAQQIMEAAKEPGTGQLVDKTV